MAASCPGQLHPLKVNPHTNEIYLPLPAPLDNIIITPPRVTDVEAHLPIHNDPRVYRMLVGPPFPYLLEHAQSWVHTTKRDSDAILDSLRKAAEMDTSIAEDGQPALIFVNGCPVRVLREVQADGSDILLGDIGIIRSNRFDHLRDKEKEKALIQRNNELPVGSPEIIWVIGYVLTPTHHGKGIMSAALRTIIHKWAVPRMNAHIIHGMAHTDNMASVKVFLKNGFKEIDIVENCVTLPENKGGGVVGLHCLEWLRLM